MTRSAAREVAVQLLFAYSFQPDALDALLDDWLDMSFFARMAEEDMLYEKPPGAEEAAYMRRLVTGAVSHLPEVDNYIQQYAIGWEFSRISRMATCIMRVAMYEILYMPDIPDAAAINEAVEIAKHYEVPEVVSFINGILGSFVRAEQPK